VNANNLDFKALKSDQLVDTGAARESRKIWFGRDTGWVETPVVERAALAAPIAGPVVLQSSDTTIIVPPDASAAPDAAGNVVVSF
jgi:N-methylhydantoinase A